MTFESQIWLPSWCLWDIISKYTINQNKGSCSAEHGSTFSPDNSFWMSWQQFSPETCQVVLFKQTRATPVLHTTDSQMMFLCTDVSAASVQRNIERPVSGDGGVCVINVILPECFLNHSVLDNCVAMAGNIFSLRTAIISSVVHDCDE